MFQPLSVFSLSHTLMSQFNLGTQPSVSLNLRNIVISKIKNLHYILFFYKCGQDVSIKL